MNKMSKTTRKVMWVAAVLLALILSVAAAVIITETKLKAAETPEVIYITEPPVESVTEVEIKIP